MALDISKCFKSTADYKLFADNMFRYTRSKLRKERMPNERILTEVSRDVSTDAIVKYISRVNNGTVVLNNKTYVKTIINNFIKSDEFIKLKKDIRQEVIVLNSSDEVINKASFTDWEGHSVSLFDGNLKDYRQRVMAIMEEESNVTFSQLELNLIELMDSGFNNREAASQLGITEGYVSKLCQGIRNKIPGNHQK